MFRVVPESIWIPESDAIRVRSPEMKIVVEFGFDWESVVLRPTMRRELGPMTTEPKT